MTLLKNPNEITKPPVISGLIYGQPGIGKTTLALSAPNPVLIDADKGLHRVEARFRVPSLPMDSYDDVLSLFKSNELDPFQTVVFDTLGKLLDRMGEYLIRQNPKCGNGQGSLSISGYGVLKGEFQKLLKLAQSKGKNIIFVAHEKEEKDGDTRIVRADATGSSGKDVVKELDFMGYMESRNNKRTISFSPSDKFYAKNSLKLAPVIEVPDTTSGNDFIQKVIIEKTQERLKEEVVENDKYQATIKSLLDAVDGVISAESAQSALGMINGTETKWDSHRIAKRRLNEKVNELGLVYSNGKFEVQKPAEVPQESAASNDSESQKVSTENAPVSDNAVAA